MVRKTSLPCAIILDSATNPFSFLFSFSFCVILVGFLFLSNIFLFISVFPPTTTFLKVSRVSLLQ